MTGKLAGESCQKRQALASRQAQDPFFQTVFGANPEERATILRRCSFHAKLVWKEHLEPNYKRNKDTIFITALWATLKKTK